MCRTEPTAFGPNWTVFNLIAKLNSYDRPLKAEDVVDVFGFSKTKVYRMSEAKQIPPPCWEEHGSMVIRPSDVGC